MLYAKHIEGALKIEKVIIFSPIFSIDIIASQLTCPSTNGLDSIRKNFLYHYKPSLPKLIQLKKYPFHLYEQLFPTLIIYRNYSSIRLLFRKAKAETNETQRHQKDH